MRGDAPWIVRFSPAAQRSLERLPERVAVAVLEYCTRTLPSDPYRLTKALHAPFEGWSVARRGDYRVYAQIIEHERELRIGRIDHRADAYRS